MKVEYINPFIEATLKSMEMMAQISATRANLSLKEDLITTFDISSIVSLNGQIEGSIIVSMPASLACKLASNMLMEEITQIDENVQDAIGEMGNIIVGDARRTLRAMNFSVDISLPNIIMGKGHKIARKQNIPCIAIPFTTEFGSFEVNVGLKDNM
ncbi:MAG: chemotaxis protein CheX [Acidobacteria bacterium]|nr:MAG: chemotaxis protein CheX [Acidobacteriota bacterium]PIE91495.1 MAG: chemotaxis protein CheX [Acidobacteriota bacterium]